MANGTGLLNPVVAQILQQQQRAGVQPVTAMIGEEDALQQQIASAIAALQEPAPTLGRPKGRELAATLLSGLADAFGAYAAGRAANPALATNFLGQFQAQRERQFGEQERSRRAGLAAELGLTRERLRETKGERRDRERENRELMREQMDRQRENQIWRMDQDARDRELTRRRNERLQEEASKLGITNAAEMTHSQLLDAIAVKSRESSGMDAADVQASNALGAKETVRFLDEVMPRLLEANATPSDIMSRFNLVMDGVPGLSPSQRERYRQEVERALSGGLPAAGGAGGGLGQAFTSAFNLPPQRPEEAALGVAGIPAIAGLQSLSQIPDIAAAAGRPSVNKMLELMLAALSAGPNRQQGQATTRRNPGGAPSASGEGFILGR